ncbi:MAG: flavodoxin family protein [Anaerovoracaceae bacterium]|jgi:multimeric flavodoxin WrbA
MEEFILVKPFCSDVEMTARIEKILAEVASSYAYELVETAEELENTCCKNRRILFAVTLGASGINLQYYKMLQRIRLEPGFFEGSVGGVIVDGKSELFTKSVARDLVFSANLSGCTFPGSPLVEGTGTLRNFNIVAKNLDTDNYGAYVESGKNLIRNVMTFQKSQVEKPDFLTIHVGNSEKSNTYSLWSLIKKELKGFDITEISLRDGEIKDCRGCAYETCLHYGEEQKCFYGGVITHEVYPAILKCDGLMMICANYNDAVSAYLTAFINRLTSIFRVHRFYEKRLYAAIVSGYSGSDILARQLIGGLNMNKTFMLPPRFAMMETANDPGALLLQEGIFERAEDFGRRIFAEFITCNGQGE